MGADNWMECPKCRKAAEDVRRKKIEQAKAMYGKVGEEEYRSAISAAERVVVLDDTFREDFEQGMQDDGEYFVSYCGRCTRCNFEFKYKHSEQALK